MLHCVRDSLKLLLSLPPTRRLIYPTRRALHPTRRAPHTTRNMTSAQEDGGDFQGHRLVWVDLEMSGLEVDVDQILEIACVISDEDLNIVAKGPNIVVHQDDEVLSSMNAWCQQHHGQSGLTQAVRDSKISLAEAEQQVLQFITRHTPSGKCPLAGNSVHEDKRFLVKYMPQFMSHLHYRIVDVSTVKEICRRWFPVEFALAPRKQASHRALDDILESIEELQYYRRTIFKHSTTPNAT